MWCHAGTRAGPRALDAAGSGEGPCAPSLPGPPRAPGPRPAAARTLGCSERVAGSHSSWAPRDAARDAGKRRTCLVPAVATLRLLLRGAVFFRLEQLPAPDAEPGSGAARVPGRCEAAPWEPASRKGSRGPAMLPLARPPRRHRRWSEWPSLPGPPPLAPHGDHGASVFGAFLGLRAHPHD